MGRWARTAMIVTVGAVLGVAAGAAADKALTVKSLTANNFPRLVVEPVGSVLRLCGTYQMKDSTGTDVGLNKVFCKDLTAAQKTTFVAFIRDDVGLILGANQAEGLEP